MSTQPSLRALVYCGSHWSPRVRALLEKNLLVPRYDIRPSQIASWGTAEQVINNHHLFLSQVLFLNNARRHATPLQSFGLFPWVSVVDVHPRFAFDFMYHPLVSQYRWSQASCVENALKNFHLMYILFSLCDSQNENQSNHHTRIHVQSSQETIYKTKTVSTLV